MRFEWDEAKRLANIVKHGVDFVDAMTIFEGRQVIRPGRAAGMELRLVAIGALSGHLIAVIFTERSQARRLISARRARVNEREAYRLVHG